MKHDAYQFSCMQAAWKYGGREGEHTTRVHRNRAVSFAYRQWSTCTVTVACMGSDCVACILAQATMVSHCARAHTHAQHTTSMWFEALTSGV
jgi:hypothetical protein